MFQWSGEVDGLTPASTRYPLLITGVGGATSFVHATFLSDSFLLCLALRLCYDNLRDEREVQRRFDSTGSRRANLHRPVGDYAAQRQSPAEPDPANQRLKARLQNSAANRPGRGLQRRRGGHRRQPVRLP